MSELIHNMNAQSFYDAMIFNMDSLGKYMLELILHQQRTPQEDHSNPIPALNVDSLKVDLVVIPNTCSEKEDINIENASNKIALFQYTESRFQTLQYNTYSNNTLGYVKKSVAERTRHQRQYERRVNKRQMQTQESKIDTGKALDANLVDTESIRTDSTVQDDNNRSGNDTDADDCRYQTHLYDRIRANGLYGTIVCWM
ncbi:hypothetical protein Tco_0442131 [Tanacetum coccineum]